MKCRVVCFLLCLCFCFYSVSLNSFAVEEDCLYTADDLIDLGGIDIGDGNFAFFGEDDPFNSGISLFSTSEKNCPDFDVVKDVPWFSFPQYIKDIIYMSLDDLTVDVGSVFKLPFVCVTVEINGNVNLWVGINVGLGQLNDASSNFSIFAVTYNETALDKIYPYSCLYRYAFNYKTDKVNLNWTVQKPTNFGNYTPPTINDSQYTSLRRFAPWNLGNHETSVDFYCYGANGVYYASRQSTLVVRRSVADPNLFVTFRTPRLGFSSGEFLPLQDNYQFNYFDYFSPPTYDDYQYQLQQEQNELQKEENETSKGIWETLKGIPEAIGEKIKGLFVPSEGFFDTYQQEFQTYFRERFGILYEIPELVVSLLQKFVTFNPKEDNYSITFPEVKLPVLEDGEWRDEVLIEEQEFSFNFINEAPFSLFYDIYIGFIWLVYILLLVNLVKNKANSVFNGG